jgi:hypothetical protein
MESHPKAEQLIRFLEGRSEGAQARVLIAHLLRGCPVCSATAEQYLPPKRKLPPNAYDVAFEKALLKTQAYRVPARPLPRLAVRQSALALPGSPI